MSVIFHIVLYSILNVSGIRKDVFGFSSIGMQFFSIVVLIFGITISASLFGMVTASLTQSVTDKREFSIDDLGQYDVSTLHGSTAQSYLLASPIKPASLAISETWRDAVAVVANNEKEVVLGDWVQLIYLSQKPEFRGKITVHNQSFQFEPYGWGLRNDLPLKDTINQELIGLLRNQKSIKIIKRYIGDQSVDIKTY